MQGDTHQEVWYNDDAGVMRRVKVCPGTDWPYILQHVPGAKVMNMTRNAEGTLDAAPYETPKYWAWGGWDWETPPLLAWDGRPAGAAIMWEAPACGMCGCRPWILTSHPLNGKSVCLECKAKGTEGWVPCPATHKDGVSCVLCRKTPGFIEEA